MELTEAAEVDGCSSWRAFSKVALPLARPGWLGQLRSHSFLRGTSSCWPLSSPTHELQTAPLALYQYIGYETFNLSPVRAAASCIVLVPTVLVVAMFQKQLITGLTFGAVRG